MSWSWTPASTWLAILDHKLFPGELSDHVLDLSLQDIPIHVVLVEHPANDPRLVLPLTEQLPDPGPGAVELEDLVGLHVDQDHMTSGHLGNDVCTWHPPVTADGLP